MARAGAGSESAKFATPACRVGGVSQMSVLAAPDALNLVAHEAACRVTCRILSRSSPDCVRKPALRRLRSHSQQPVTNDCGAKGLE